MTQTHVEMVSVKKWQSFLSLDLTLQRLHCKQAHGNKQMTGTGLAFHFWQTLVCVFIYHSFLLSYEVQVPIFIHKIIFPLPLLIFFHATLK